MTTGVLGPNVNNQAAIYAFVRSCAEELRLGVAAERSVAVVAAGLDSVLAAQLAEIVKRTEGEAEATRLKAAMAAEEAPGHGLLDAGFSQLSRKGLPSTVIDTIANHLTTMLNNLEAQAKRGLTSM